MNKSCLLALVLSLFSFFTSASPQLTISWKFLHVQDGYDHLNKIEVYIDGTLTSTSESFHESDLGTHRLSVPKGMHKIRVKNYAFYEGAWEEHTVAEGYSIDAEVEQEHKFKKRNHLTLLWDIDKYGDEALTVAWKKPTPKLLMEPILEKTGASLDVAWKFSGVKEGFDHSMRLVVYADGKKIFTSPIAKSSVGNMFKVNMPKECAEIRIVAEAFYEGSWEEHTVKNSYSIDAQVVKNDGIGPKMSVTIDFNLDDKKINAVWK